MWCLWTRPRQNIQLAWYPGAVCEEGVDEWEAKACESARDRVRGQERGGGKPEKENDHIKRDGERGEENCLLRRLSRSTFPATITRKIVDRDSFLYNKEQNGPIHQEKLVFKSQDESDLSAESWNCLIKISQISQGFRLVKSLVVGEPTGPSKVSITGEIVMTALKILSCKLWSLPPRWEQSVMTVQRRLKTWKP